MPGDDDGFDDRLNAAKEQAKVHRPRPRPRANGGGASPDWLSRCHVSANGNPLANLFNACLALRADPLWAGRLRFDEMRRASVLDRTLVDDLILARLQEWMQDHGLRRMGQESVRDAVEIVAHEHAFHPLRTWLEALEWDGEPRIAGWLARHLGCRDDDYHASIGAWFLTSMVARVTRPGCKADYMLVLEGPQGILKSSVCAVLGGAYYSDALPDLGTDHVRVSMHLRGKWVIEVPELSAFSRAEATRLKAFLTQTEEQYTAKFARREAAEKRQCVFIATTNDSGYIKDETGGRRFWPVKCGEIGLAGLRAARDQLFAEAMAAFRDGARWWPDRAFEQSVIEPQQATRQWSDAWEEPIGVYLARKSRVTMMDVALDALGMEKARVNVLDQRRIASVLRALGWNDRKGTGGTRIWEPKR